MASGRNSVKWRTLFARTTKKLLTAFGVRLQALLQFLAVAYYIFLWVVLPIVSTWLPFYILFCTPLWWTMVLYGLWYVYDFNTPRSGSRRWNAFRRFAVWKYFADYFPIRLVKTAELSPEKNYIMGCHPHGVFSIGAFTSLCTEGTHFSDTFPNINSTILTLNGQFYFPFRREVGELFGACEVSKQSLTYLLTKPGKGRLVGIVIGGAEEALDAVPGRHDLNIRHRRGFCRFALKFGADLVPSYSFGENDVYDQTMPNPRGSNLRKVQSRIKAACGFCPPLFAGRGFFPSMRGMLPYRHPINTVVGAPISVTRVEDPTEEEVETLHDRYLAALVTLFETHKRDYGVSEEVHLNLW